MIALSAQHEITLIERNSKQFACSLVFIIFRLNQNIKMMKSLTLLFFCLAFYASGHAQQPINGAYLAKNGDTSHLWLFIDGYSSYIKYKDDAYQCTWGGPFSVHSNSILVDVEYNDKQPDEVGRPKHTGATYSSDEIQLGKLRFTRQEGNQQDLDGLWRITGRQQDGEISNIPRGDRKTIKLLVDGFFQWIAINPAEKGFYGTGGGHYLFQDGQYTENILFFSRDDKRVGASLRFKGELKAEEWHHSGLSSKGDAIYEIWSKEK